MIPNLSQLLRSPKNLRMMGLLLFLAGLICGCGKESRPNILLAIADDWSWPHAGAYGAAVVDTPAFDRIAEEGILFENAYVSAPSCTPSRAALLTGQWHWRLRESANLWSTLQKDIPTYPALLEATGYHVGFMRKGWGPGRLEPGGRDRNPAGPSFDSFAAFLDAKEPGQPFAFWFGSLDPHRPYDRDSGRDSGMDLESIEVPPIFPDLPEVRGDMADYFHEVERFDRELGEMLLLLESTGELENTLVVITGDNGMPFPRCKATLYDCGTRVPLAIAWPAQDLMTTQPDAFVSLTDLAPTFLEAAGVEIPQVMTGRSLMPLLKGEGGEERDHVLTGMERHVPCQEAPESGGTPMRALRTRDFLLIRNFEPARWPAGTPNYRDAYLPGSWYGNVDNGPTKFVMVERAQENEEYLRLFGLAFSKRPEWEFYDLRFDPEQTNNLARDPEYAGQFADYQARLMAALRDSEDPRAEGGGDSFDEYPYYGGTPLKPGYDPETESE